MSHFGGWMITEWNDFLPDVDWEFFSPKIGRFFDLSKLYSRELLTASCASE
jgi:hypothetical protein